MTTHPLPKYDKSGSPTCITSPFGPRWGGVHNGTDEGSQDGIEIGVTEHANDEGTIERVSAGPEGGAGINIWLRTTRLMFNRYGRLCVVGYKYFHMNRVTVKVGQHVNEGDVVGEVGNTGTVAAHIHQQMHLLDGLAGEWTDRTAVSHTEELQWLINNNFFPGVVHPTPNPVPNPGDDMPTMEELKAELLPAIALEIAASADKVITACAPEDEKWMGTWFPSEEDKATGTGGKVYIVAYGKKYHVPGTKQHLIPVLEFLGFDNRGIQGIGNGGALEALPEGAWTEVGVDLVE